MKKRDSIAHLRKESEKQVRKPTEAEIDALSTSAGTKKLIHELKVHQIELEMQNEELRRAHVELEDSRSRYSDLYDFAPVGYFTLSEKGLVLEVNLTGASMLGAGRSHLIKKPFSQYILHDYKDKFYLHCRKVFDTSERQTCEIKLRNKKGAEFYAELVSILCFDLKGRKTCRMSLNDITEKKRAEEELARSSDQLIQSEKMAAMGQMAGGLAHELNSPLGGLLPMIEKFRNDVEKGSQEHVELSLMLKACEHMARIVRDFTSFSRESKGRVYKLSLNKVIEDTLCFSSSWIKTKGIQLILDLNKKLPRVRGDKTQLQQVVLNMLSNARDAMPDGGKLLIRTAASEDNRKAIMEFIDNGSGINKKDLKSLFDPFYTTKRPGKGTGLGLSVSYGIIQKHGGEISVQSKKGEGTTFIIYLPALLSETAK